MIDFICPSDLTGKELRMICGGPPSTCAYSWPALTLSGMAKPAALGFKLHTGWAVLVVLAGVPGRLEVLLRRRIELLPSGDSIPRFIYHQAAELPPAPAAEVVQRAENASLQTAHLVVNEVLEHLRSLVLEVKAAGIASGARPGCLKTYRRCLVPIL
jgi:hypothetical protein